jgi:hypothetical protein
MNVVPSLLALCGLLGMGLGSALSQGRPPATPLITHDPYFSVWSMTDRLTDSDTAHWTGSAQPIAGIARIDGKPYRFMGKYPNAVPAMEQTAHTLTPTHTYYEFKQGGVTLELTFFTPLLPDDLDLISRPVTYLTWSATANDGASHKVSLLLDVDPVIAVNDRNEQVITGRHRTDALDVLSVGSRDQDVLNRSGDNLRIDWGYFHLAVPHDEPSMSSIAPRAIDSFVASGRLPASDAIVMPEVAGRSAPHLAVELDLPNVTSQPTTRHLLLAYTDGYGIQYLQRNLRSYWQRNNMPVEEMLNTAEAQYASLEQRGRQFDEELTADLVKAGGAHYAAIAVLSYRQAMAAHKLVADANGDPMLFAKENSSNGCIATVDVMYPSAPLFLFLQPRLLEAQLLPVLEYAALSRWKFPFSPHDLGQYPLANGQVYGGGEQTEEDQMPVEESGNMLILLDALARAQGTPQLSKRYWPQLTKWAEYLRQNGLDPENQLTTDDFAGHVAHNANLSIKAIEALAAYADLAHMVGEESVARDYSAAAKEMASKWVSMAEEGDHYKLAFNSPDTWSQKYNLVWDELLDFKLFPSSVREKEVAYYLTKINTYGLPLDIRKDYTKLDWSIWTATLASNREQFDRIVDPIYTWMNETSSRTPLPDWYDTRTGKQESFQARSVVGGVYIKALADKQLTAKWRRKASHE